MVVPLTDTFTPINGSPFESTTVPLSSFCCAKALLVPIVQSAKAAAALVMLLRIELLKEGSFIFFLLLSECKGMNKKREDYQTESSSHLIGN